MINRPTVLQHKTGDRTGMLIAALCFVHCVAGPLLLSFAGLASFTRVSERFEPVFLAGSFIMGTSTLIPAYRNKHRRRSCLAMFIAGLLCFLMRSRMPSGDIPSEPVAAGAGAMLIIGAHLLNLRCSKQCRCCEPPKT